MYTFVRIAGLAVLLGAGAVNAAPAAGPQAVTGRWDAVLVDNGPEVPFRLDIEGKGTSLKGVFYDGVRPNESTSASFQRDTLVLKSERYHTVITATLKGDELSGDTTLQGPGFGIKYGFHAVRHDSGAKRRDELGPVQNARALSEAWTAPP